QAVPCPPRLPTPEPSLPTTPAGLTGIEESQHVDQTRPHRPISYRSSLAARRSVLPRAAVGFHAQADPERDPSPEEEQEHQGAEEDRGAGGPGHQADQ